MLPFTETLNKARPSVPDKALEEQIAHKIGNVQVIKIFQQVSIVCRVAKHAAGRDHMNSLRSETAKAGRLTQLQHFSRLCLDGFGIKKISLFSDRQIHAGARTEQNGLLKTQIRLVKTQEQRPSFGLLGVRSVRKQANTKVFRLINRPPRQLVKETIKQSISAASIFPRPGF